MDRGERDMVLNQGWPTDPWALSTGRCGLQPEEVECTLQKPSKVIKSHQ